MSCEWACRVALAVGIVMSANSPFQIISISRTRHSLPSIDDRIFSK